MKRIRREPTPPPAPDAEVVAWLAAGLPHRPEAATRSNPGGQFTFHECLSALARELTRLEAGINGGPTA